MHVTEQKYSDSIDVQFQPDLGGGTGFWPQMLMVARGGGK
jgi:hypothetical protein